MKSSREKKDFELVLSESQKGKIFDIELSFIVNTEVKFSLLTIIIIFIL